MLVNNMIIIALTYGKDTYSINKIRLQKFKTMVDGV